MNELNAQWSPPSPMAPSRGRRTHPELVLERPRHSVIVAEVVTGIADGEPCGSGDCALDAQSAP
jgi:hypothetical protein